MSRDNIAAKKQLQLWGEPFDRGKTKTTITQIKEITWEQTDLWGEIICNRENEHFGYLMSKKDDHMI